MHVFGYICIHVYLFLWRTLADTQTEERILYCKLSTKNNPMSRGHMKWSVCLKAFEPAFSNNLEWQLSATEQRAYTSSAFVYIFFREKCLTFKMHAPNAAGHSLWDRWGNMSFPGVTDKRLTQYNTVELLKPLSALVKLFLFLSCACSLMFSFL